MGVKITDRKYFNQFYTPANSTDWLIGNVGDWQRLDISFDVTIDFFATTSESVSLDNTNKTITLNNGKSWSDYGFDIGDVIEMTFQRDYLDANNETQTSSLSSSLNVTNMYGDTFEHDTNFTASWFIPLNIIPTDRGSEKIYNVKFKTKKESEGLKIRYTHLSNDDASTNNLISLIDGSVTELSFAGLNNLINNVEVPINPDGIQSGMAIEKGLVSKISYNSSTGVGKYKISLFFMMGVLFSQPSDLADKKAPEFLFNSKSLTDNFEIEVYPEWNNPNTIVKNDLSHTERLGNTGWFNENFNGLDNNFKIDSFKYYDDDGNVLTQLDYSKPVNVELIVSGIKNLSSLSEFGLGFSWIPQNDDDYKNKNTPYHKNLFISTGRKYTDGLNDSFNLGELTGTNLFEGNSNNNAKMNIQSTDNALVVVSGTDSIKLKSRFIPSAEFTTEFENKNENDRNYILWVSVADQNLQINFSDRASLLVDYNEMVKITPPSGPFPGMTNRFIEHPQGEGVVGVEKYFGFVEDDVLARIGFKIDTSDKKVLQSMSFGYEVVNVETGLAFALENYNVNLSSYPVDSSGIQNINVTETKGYKMNDGNNKNIIKIIRDDVNDVGNIKSYKAFFPAKIRWEDWIPKDNVPSEFFSIDKENDGFNNDWIDYLRNGDNYVFNFFVLTEVIEDGEYKLHKNTFELTFNDYDENLNIETTHQYIRQSDDTVLNIGIDPISGKPLGVLLSDEPTKIEITFTNLTEDFDITKMYGVITMEIDKGAGVFEHRQLSSVWDSENDNFLIPLPGETRLKFEQIAPNIVKTSCLTDNNRLQNALRYKVSGRIGCFPEGNGNNETQGKYDSNYQDLYE